MRILYGRGEWKRATVVSSLCKEARSLAWPILVAAGRLKFGHDRRRGEAVPKWNGRDGERKTQ